MILRHHCIKNSFTSSSFIPGSLKPGFNLVTLWTKIGGCLLPTKMSQKDFFIEMNVLDFIE